MIAQLRQSGFEAIRGVLLLWGLLTAITPSAHAATMLTLEQVVYFTDSDGSRLVAHPGTYTVEAPRGSLIKLTAEGRERLLIEGQATTHSEIIVSPLATILRSEKPDVLHLILLLPNGLALDAAGSVTAVAPHPVIKSLLTAAQIKVAVNLQPGEMSGDQLHPKTLFTRIEYLGNYPPNKKPGWSEELQGLAHDGVNWFMAQKGRLWKFPVTHDLNRQVNGPDPSRGILSVGIPAELRKQGYDHFGDLDQYGGFLFVPLEGEAIKPRIAVFRASNLSFVGSFVLTGQNRAGWCALRHEPGGVHLYTSNNVINQVNPIFRYKVDLGRVSASPSAAFRFVNTVELFNGASRLNIKPYLQGGEFSPDGSYLFLTNGSRGVSTQDSGIWVFRADPMQFVTKSTALPNSGSFFYEFHPGHPVLTKWQEPEGITFWDLDGRQAPGLPGGQLHVILLDNNWPSADEVFIKHYRLAR